MKDTTALEDMTPLTASNISFGNVDLLKEVLPAQSYATLEQDFFRLDGSMQEMPDTPEDVPMWSSECTGESGTFTTNPVLTITFTENHTSFGLTFHFASDWPLQMQVRWYSLDGNLISFKTCSPDSADYFLQNLVENFGKIEVEFQKTLPYRYAKLWSIEYGTTIIWGEDVIKSASITEDVDPVSATLKSSELTFQFLDMAGEYSLANSDGIHRALQQNQFITPYEIVNGERIFLGRYFLKNPGNNKALVKMSATNYIGLLDYTDFKNGMVYDGNTAGSVIAGIFSGTDIPYVVDADVAEIPLYGWLKIQTRRNALKEVLFACGAIAETSRQDKIHIRKANRMAAGVVGRDRKFSTSSQKDTYISEVSIKYSEYTPGTEEKELVKAATYPAGSNEVKFNSPVSDIRLSSGTIVETKTNYIIFTLDEDAQVTIYGKQYSKQDVTISSSVKKLDAGQNTKTKSFTGALFNYERAKAVSQDLLDHYQLSLILNIRYLADQELPGNWIEVENEVKGRGSYVAGFESIRTDLTGGFISTAKLRGYYKLSSSFAYAGTEIYAGEDGGAM